MKVAHFCFSDDIGAGGAAYELHNALRKKDIESTFFVINKTRDDDTIISLENSNNEKYKIYRAINQFYARENRVKGSCCFSLDIVGVDISTMDPDIFKEYDIFHLHWIPEILSIEDINTLKSFKKPIVWTIHDFQPFTGGCHCPEKCEGYITDCDNCSQLIIDKYNIAKYILRQKAIYFKDGIDITVASDWLYNIVKASKVFKNADTYKIPIGINIDSFNPINKLIAKEKLGFSSDAKIMLIGAQSVSQNIKGYPYLYKAMEIIYNDSYCKKLIEDKKLHFLSFGRNGDKLLKMDIPLIDLGFIDDKERLSTIYSAADVFIFPSIQETFGMSAVEAMACKTPVVAFDTCAMSEVITDGINGYKSPVEDFTHMASNIINIIKNDPINKDACRNVIAERYTTDIEAAAMLKLYNNLILNNSSGYVDKFVEDKNVEDFIKTSIFDIINKQAINQRNDTSILKICMEGQSLFLTAVQKVGVLISDIKIEIDDKIVLYGTGAMGKQLSLVLKNNGFSVNDYWDSSKARQGQTFFDSIIMAPRPYSAEENIKIIIACYDCSAVREIADTLTEIGYTENKNFFK